RRHPPPQRPERPAVQPFRVPLVDPVLGAEAPVAVADRPPAGDCGVLAEELRRDVSLDVRGLRVVADVEPDEAEPLLDRVGPNPALAGNWRVRPVRDRGHELARGEVKGPAVVTAGPRARELLPRHRVAERHASVRAAIVERVYLPLLPTQHDLLAEHL